VVAITSDQFLACGLLCLGSLLVLIWHGCIPQTLAYESGKPRTMTYVTATPHLKRPQKRMPRMFATVLRYNKFRARIHLYTCANASESPDLFRADGERIEFSRATCSAAQLFGGAERVRRR